MAVHDLRKHIAWYLKGFPVGGSIRKAFMECESLADVDREIGKLDPTIEYPPRVVDKPRGRVRFAKKVHLRMAGWNRVPPPTKSVRRSSVTTQWTPVTEKILKIHATRAILRVNFPPRVACLRYSWV